MKLFQLFLLLLLATPSFAAIEAYTFETDEQEETYKELIEELRCVVCQNQNIADSNAERAQDLRKLTYEMVQQGKSKSEVIDFMVARYGDFVLYRPPFKLTTLFLWIGPFIILVGGVWLLIALIRNRPAEEVEELTEEQHQKMAELLEKKQEDNN